MVLRANNGRAQYDKPPLEVAISIFLARRDNSLFRQSKQLINYFELVVLAFIKQIALEICKQGGCKSLLSMRQA